MGALIEYLETMLARHSSGLELVRAVEDELSGGDLLDDEVCDPRQVMALASHRESTMRRGRPGPQAVACASRGGIYLPREIRRLAGQHAADAEWMTRESLRFLCFEIVLRELIGRAARAKMPPEDLDSAVVELATRLSRVRIHAGQATQPAFS